MFVTHTAPLNGLDPGDKMPEGANAGIGGGDWVWKPRAYSQDPGYAYTSGDIAAVYPSGYEAGRPFLHSRGYPEYRGNPPRPARIGSYVG